jgi:transposase
MTKNRRTYTDEFKREAVQLSNASEKSIAQVARELGIAPKLLYRWRSEQRALGDEAFPGQGHTVPQELSELQQELVEVQRERDILKKALAIFSRGVLS